MKKILVTGGFGFIGSTLVEILLKDHKNKIHIIDDMSSSSISIDDYVNNLSNKKNLSYSIETVDSYFQKIKDGDYDEIYHLASPVGPAGVLKHGGNIIREVCRDIYLIIDYCIKNNIKVLDVSTSEIYGGGQNGYCTEITNKVVTHKTSVRLEYAIAKLAAETALMNMQKLYGLKCTIVRPFNVAGPRQSPKGGFVLPRFIQQAYTNKPITVFGDGSAIRAFTHVRDMANGIILAMNKGKDGEAYNIGNEDNKTTILNLANVVKKILNSNSEIVFVDPKKIYGEYYEEASDKYPDSTKAKIELGFEAKLGIEKTIIDATEEYLRQTQSGIISADHIV